ncbi:unnamed protein product [Urochloa humidicola]
MAQAVDFTTRSNALMAKAHHQCFTSMQKLLDDARAEKLAANEARRVRPRNDRPPRAQAHAASDAGTPLAENLENCRAVDVDELEQESAGDAEQCGAHDVEEPEEEPADDPELYGAGDVGEPEEDADPFDAQPLEMQNDGDMGSGGGGEYMEGLFTGAHMVGCFVLMK